MGEMGRYPTMINIIEHILNYWHHLDKPGYSTKLLEEAKNEMLLLKDNKATWFYGIKQIFSSFQLRWDCNPPRKVQIRQLIQKLKSSYERYLRKKSVGLVNRNSKFIV